MPARSGLVLTALGAVAALLVPVAPAQALIPQQIVAYSSSSDGYRPGDIIIFEGDTLTFTNLDHFEQHDLIALDYEAGHPMFRAAIVAFGVSTPVNGVSALPPSTYPFQCSVHDLMHGTIEVRARPAS
jgi:plastocyanin